MEKGMNSKINNNYNTNNLNILNYILQDPDKLITNNLNSTKFKNKELEKQYRKFLFFEKYQSISVTIIFVLLILLYLVMIYDVFSCHINTKFLVMPIVGLLINICWFIITKRKRIIDGNISDILKYLNFFCYLFIACFLLIFKINQVRINIIDGDLSPFFIYPSKSFMTDLYSIVAVSFIINLLLFKRMNITIFMSLFSQLICILYMVTIFSPSVSEVANEFKSYFTQLAQRNQTSSNFIPSKNIKFQVDAEKVSQMLYLKEIFFVFLTNIFLIIIKSLITNIIRSVFILYYKYKKYYQNGKDVALESDIYQISLIKNSDYIKLFINQNLKNLINEFKFNNILIDDNHIEIANPTNILKHKKQFLTNDIPIIKESFVSDTKKNNSNMHSKEYDDAKNTIINPISNSKQNLVITNSNNNIIGLTYCNTNYLNNEFSDKNNNMIYNTQTSNNHIHSKERETFEEKILNKFLEKIIIKEVKPIYSGYYRENNIKNLSDFLKFLKDAMNYCLEKHKNKLKNKESLSYNDEINFKLLEKIIFTNEIFTTFGKVLITDGEVEYYFTLKIRYIKELGVVDMILTNKEFSCENIKNLKTPKSLDMSNLKSRECHLDRTCKIGSENRNINNDSFDFHNNINKLHLTYSNQRKESKNFDNIDNRNITNIESEKNKFFDDNSDQNKLKFFSKITHEFKTPINSIIGLITKMKTGFKNLVYNGQQQQDLNVNNLIFDNDMNLILNLSNYTIYLINDLIQYSQLGTNLDSIKFNIEQIDLHEILDFCYNIAKSLIICNQTKSNKIKAIFDFDEKIKGYTIKSDEIRLKQIILNLISNSVKFTKRGNIVIKAEISYDKKSVFVSIIDSGLGIKEEDIGKLFQDNVMLENGKKLNSFGSGLGLSIIKNFTENMGIKIFVESKINVGSCFRLIIPCYTPLRNFSDNQNDFKKSKNRLNPNMYSKFFNAPIVNVKKSTSLVNRYLKNPQQNKLSDVEIGMKIYKNPIFIDNSSEKDNNFLENLEKSKEKVDELPRKNPMYQKDKDFSEKIFVNRNESVTNNINSEFNYSICYTNSFNACEFQNVNNDNLNNHGLSFKEIKPSSSKNIQKNAEIKQNQSIPLTTQLSPYSCRYTNADVTTKLNENIFLAINNDELDANLMEKIRSYTNFSYNDITNMTANINQLQENEITNKGSFNNTSNNNINTTFNQPTNANSGNFNNTNATLNQPANTNNNNPTNNYLQVNDISKNAEILSKLSPGSKIRLLSNNSVQNYYNSEFRDLCGCKSAKEKILEEAKNSLPKILIVDDNQFIIESFKKIMCDLKAEKHLNYDIIEGNDGLDILNKVIENQNDGLLKCVFTDENMEYINGSEAIKIVRNLERNNKISKNIIVSMTSYEDNQSKELILNSGADFIISKPYSKNQILTALTKFNLIK